MIINNEIEINTNILETNIINIVILVGLIVYVGKGFITNSVDQRRNQILKTLETLDNNLNQANLKFIDSTKQLEQINLIIFELQENNKNQKISSLNRKYEKFYSSITLLFDFLVFNINKNKLDSVRSLERFLLTFAIGKVLNRCAKLNSRDQQKFLDSFILKFREKNK